MTYRDLLYSVEDRVATITLNRPKQLNALSQNLVRELIAAVAEADADPDARVIVVAGAGGKAFSSGYDIKESAEQPKRTLVDWRARMQMDIKFTYSVWDCSKPTIAMIDGYCLAGGLEFALCFDIRYCSDDAKFGAVEARFSNGIATMMMPWLIGQRCRALIYTGDTIDASEAFRLGLVDRVFPKAKLAAEVTKIARRMSRVSMDCLKWNKRAINQTFEIMGLRNAIQYGSEACAIMDATSSPEAEQYDAIRRSQGLAAALEWRAEQFAPYE
ncbi:MAG TPA: enoyl-CoA hydratase/isomerase family protein [Alphaproteobacteria bacterium]|nr:enoyl-CoA hydratase/isomerase family protein [Alphaproteobacteria bacterium]